MEFFDYNPNTGIKRFSQEADGKFFIHACQDVELLIERNKILKNEGITDKGIKNDWWHWASIPDTVYLELRKRGIDMFKMRDEDMQRRFRKIINSEYPALKTTYKTHV